MVSGHTPIPHIPVPVFSCILAFQRSKVGSLNIRLGLCQVVDPTNTHK